MEPEEQAEEQQSEDEPEPESEPEPEPEPEPVQTDLDPVSQRKVWCYLCIVLVFWESYWQWAIFNIYAFVGSHLRLLNCFHKLYTFLQLIIWKHLSTCQCDFFPCRICHNVWIYYEKRPLLAICCIVKETWIIDKFCTKCSNSPFYYHDVWCYYKKSQPSTLAIEVELIICIQMGI